MGKPITSFISRSVQRRLDPEALKRLKNIRHNFNEYGYDPWGMHPDYLLRFALAIKPLYDKYFRVETYGLKNLPEGRVLLIANHSGQVPIDGVMIALALLFEADPPRFARAMVEYFAWQLPFVSTAFARLGQVIGTPENCRRLLDADETILVFPEGVNGISQPFNKRYQLQKFGTGFMRLALDTKTPIVPVAVIGCEEMVPGIGRLPVPKGLGIPYVPLTPTFPWLGPLGLIPLPAKVRLYFGEPMEFKGEPNDEDVIVERKVKRVRMRLQSMLNDGVKRREHVFW